jgi:hypothetical protein
MRRSNSHQKTKELILYVANKLPAKANYGSTLLNKALYFIDNIAYLKTGNPISEFKYVKQQHGPTPEPVMFLSIKEQLEVSGELEIIEAEYFGRIQKRFIAKRAPSVDVFTAAQIAIMDDVLSSIGDWNGSEASDFSHQFPAWQVAEDKEELPFFTFLLTSSPPREEDIAWAKSEIKKCLQ